MGMGGQSKGGVKSDINVTPLVDVCLVLLIIFMVVTPMLQSGKDVQLPKAKQVAEKDKDGNSPIHVSITADKKAYFEQDLANDAELEDKLRVEYGKNPARKLLLKADQSLTFGDVRRVMNVTRKAGAKAVQMAVEELKDK